MKIAFLKRKKHRLGQSVKLAKQSKDDNIEVNFLKDFLNRFVCFSTKFLVAFVHLHQSRETLLVLALQACALVMSFICKLKGMLFSRLQHHCPKWSATTPVIGNYRFSDQGPVCTWHYL